MALSGLHVACSFAGGPGAGGVGSIPLLGSPIWSETLASAGTTTAVAPQADQVVAAVFSVRASADAWIATGANPNASSGPRQFLAANTDRDFFVKAGDKLAWIAA